MSVDVVSTIKLDEVLPSDVESATSACVNKSRLTATASYLTPLESTPCEMGCTWTTNNMWKITTLVTVNDTYESGVGGHGVDGVRCEVWYHSVIRGDAREQKLAAER